MIGDNFTEALQVSQFRIFHNIILGIHEDDIPPYKASGRASLEEQNLKLNKDKEEAHNSDKLVVN